MGVSCGLASGLPGAASLGQGTSSLAWLITYASGQRGAQRRSAPNGKSGCCAVRGASLTHPVPGKPNSPRSAQPALGQSKRTGGTGSPSAWPSRLSPAHAFAMVARDRPVPARNEPTELANQRMLAVGGYSRALGGSGMARSAARRHCPFIAGWHKSTCVALLLALAAVPARPRHCGMVPTRSAGMSAQDTPARSWLARAAGTPQACRVRSRYSGASGMAPALRWLLGGGAPVTGRSMHHTHCS